MPWFNCGYGGCGKRFYSKHSTAKYCSRSCAGKVNGRVSRIGKTANSRSNQEILLGLVELAGKLGRTPSKREVEACSSVPGESVIRARFGTYNNAIIKAGLVPNMPDPEKSAKAFRIYKTERGIRPSLRFSVLERDGFRCQYCGGTPQQGYTLQMDHIVPVSEGGKTRLNNLTTSCWMCNVGKGDSVIDE